MLTVNHIEKRFGNVVAVNDISFSIPRGSTFGLLGPNGAGKTTTMRLVLGIMAPDRGSITWDGHAVTRHTRRHFGYLPEERGLYAKMKVREQIMFFGRLHGLTEPDITKRTDHWLEHLKLWEYANRPSSELSKGNQQKVQVACAAVHDPELLVLDEPFSGLDPVNAEMLLSVLREQQQRGTTLVLSSHQMWQLEDLCTEFCIIAGGQTRANGSLAQLRAQWPTRVLRVAPDSSAVRDVLGNVPGAQPIGQNADALDVQIPANTQLPAVLKELVGREAITRFEAIEPSLQDIYLRATGAAA